MSDSTITPADGTPQTLSSDAPTEGGAFGTIGDQTFQTKEEFEAFIREQNPDAVPPAPAPKEGEAAAPAKAAEVVEPKEVEPAKDDTPSEEKKAFVPDTRTDDEIKASLKEAGGFFADPRYEAGAIEFARTGDVSPGTRAKIATEFAVPADMVDTFIEGQKAMRENAAAASERATTEAQTKVNATVTAIHEVAGGKEQFETFKAWAIEGKGLAEAEIASLVEAIDSTPRVAAALIKEYMAKFKASGQGGGPRDITQRSPSQANIPPASDAVTGYASMAEQQKDQSDPRYSSDKAFRDKVIARIGKSTF